MLQHSIQIDDQHIHLLQVSLHVVSSNGLYFFTGTYVYSTNTEKLDALKYDYHKFRIVVIIEYFDDV